MISILSNGRPDTTDLSLKDSIELKQLKRKNTDEYRQNLFYFYDDHDSTGKCMSCGSAPTAYTVRQPDGTDQVHVSSVRMINYRGYKICDDCFVAYWTYDETLSKPKSGRSRDPASDRNYHGGQFHAGEW